MRMVDRASRAAIDVQRQGIRKGEVDEAVRRSRDRARMVYHWDDLPDAARDAYLLALHVETLQEQVESLTRFKRNTLYHVKMIGG